MKSKEVRKGGSLFCLLERLVERGELVVATLRVYLGGRRGLELGGHVQIGRLQ